MDYKQAVMLHKVLTELHTGMIVLAVFAAAVALAFPNWKRETLGKAADATFIFASSSGLLFVILAALSGFMAWPWERLWQTPMVYSKVTFAFLAIVVWANLIFARLNYGIEIWRQQHRARMMAAGLVIGVLTIGMAGSAGGQLGHGASLIDPLFQGFDPYVPIVWPLWFAVGVLVSATYCGLLLYLQRGRRQMTLLNGCVLVLLFLTSAFITKTISSESSTSVEFVRENGVQSARDKSTADETAANQEHHHQTPPKQRFQPAEGASVKILSPKPGQTFRSDQIPIQFKLVKGKRGHHVHAYVDKELMGMFESEKGTLNGIKPGRHILELRVVTEDHSTELDSSDRVSFVVE